MLNGFLSMLAEEETSTPEITALAQKILFVTGKQQELIELMGELIDAMEAIDRRVEMLEEPKAKKAKKVAAK